MYIGDCPLHDAPLEAKYTRPFRSDDWRVYVPVMHDHLKGFRMMMQVTVSID